MISIFAPSMEEKKKQILEKASSLVPEIWAIRSVTMDDVAREVRHLKKNSLSVF